MAEQEVLDARRAFATAQQLLAGVAVERVEGLVAVGWYDTAVNPETGSFALVRREGPLTDLIGEIVHVSAGDRSVFAYVLGSAGVPTDLALARRAFFALGLLALESLDCVVEVVQ